MAHWDHAITEREKEKCNRQMPAFRWLRRIHTQMPTVTSTRIFTCAHPHSVTVTSILHVRDTHTNTHKKIQLLTLISNKMCINTNTLT